MLFEQHYANLYDEIHADRPYLTQTRHLQQLVDRYVPRELRDFPVLDFGCGTGTHALLLAELGFQVTGVDRSSYMLRQAREKATERHLEIDFCDELPSTGKFKAVFSLFDVINYLPSEDLKAHLKHFHRILVDGGIAVLETWNGEGVPLHWEQLRKKTIPGRPGFFRVSETELDIERQTARIQLTCYEEVSCRVLANELHVMNYYSAQELTSFFGHAGFQVQALLAPYTWETPSRDHFRVEYVLQKRVR